MRELRDVISNMISSGQDIFHVEKGFLNFDKEINIELLLREYFFYR